MTTKMNLYRITFNELPYYVEAADVHNAITVWRRAMRAQGLADPDDEPDVTKWLNDEPAIREHVMSVDEAKLREEVEQLRVQLAAAVGETNRQLEHAQAYRNIRVLVLDQERVDERRRKLTAENGAAAKVPA